MKKIKYYALAVVACLAVIASYFLYRASHRSSDTIWYDQMSIDLRADTSEKGTYRVWLCARPGIPGHAFLLLTSHPADEDRVFAEAIGLYPETSPKLVAFGEPLIVTDETARPGGLVITPEVVISMVRISKHEFEDLKLRLPEKGKHSGLRYFLLVNDCVGLIQDVAFSLGKEKKLALPSRIGVRWFPVPYLEEFIRLNERKH